MGSYRGYYDQLAIDPDGKEPRSVSHVLKDLRTTRCKGVFGEGGPYPVTSYTGTWVDSGPAQQQHLSGFGVEGGIVVIRTESRDW
ncbi:hypothetical protein NG702_19090 [Pseudarthrobacter sp. MDT3-28]|uniref:hypothetical protein n=1 Tax=Pseudarthrobacter raffinosi TaxID=2953651 RepID=UPI00208EA87F|nr:hypothetical protein [Pseudarthrobacter sp. MDT3-28]MCO4239483.1 hypothetical protein [Pseudarthrobacter sp. MDT3-28]